LFITNIIKSLSIYKQNWGVSEFAESDFFMAEKSIFLDEIVKNRRKWLIPAGVA
jgi:hypothetical protein